MDLILVRSFVIRVSPFFVIRVRGMVREMIASGEYCIEEGLLFISPVFDLCNGPIRYDFCLEVMSEGFQFWE